MQSTRRTRRLSPLGTKMTLMQSLRFQCLWSNPDTNHRLVQLSVGLGHWVLRIPQASVECKIPGELQTCPKSIYRSIASRTA